MKVLRSSWKKKPASFPTEGKTPPAGVSRDGDTVILRVALYNTSGVDFVGADASVTGTTTVFLSCIDAQCTVELSALTFDACTPAPGVDVWGARHG